MTKDDQPAPPEFVQQARPLRVDPAMLALKPETIVRLHTVPGLSTGVTQATAADCVAWVEEQIARQAKDLFTLDEAAQVLVEAAPGSHAEDFIHRLMVATVRGKPLPRDRGSLLPVADPTRAKTHYSMCLAKVDDINAWLEDEGVPYRFPTAPPTESEQLTKQSSAPVLAAGAATKTSQAAEREGRQNARLAHCEAKGIIFDKASLLRLPSGIAKAALAIVPPIKRQSLAIDVKAALERRFAEDKNGKK